MFDSPFDDQVPGKLALVGFPWHGLLTLPSSTAENTAKIDLPNGQQKILPRIFSTPSASAFSLPGDTLLFKDPRATETVRTPEQQVKDVAAGREWEPDIVYGPFGRVLYGQQVSASWILHGESFNYAVSMNAPSNISVNRLVLNRSPGEIGSSSVALTQVGSYSSPLYGGSIAYVVLDATKKGDKALLGLYLRREDSAVPNQARLMPCRIPMVELWEVRLQIVDGEVVGEYECIRTPDEVIGEIDSPAYPDSVLRTAEYWVVWTKTGTSPDIWTGEGSETVEGTPVGRFQNGLTRSPWSYRESGRLVSAYYDDEELVKDIRVSIAVDDSLSSTLTPTTSSSPTVVEGSNPPGGGGNIPKLITPGEHTLDVSYSHEANSLATLTLLDDGFAVSTVTIESTGTQTSSYSASLTYESGLNNSADPVREESQSSTLSNTHTITCDGSVIYSVSATSSSIGGDAKCGIYDLVGRGVNQPWVTWRTFGATTDDQEFEIFPIRYSSQMHALAAAKINTPDPDQTTVGNVASRGAVAAGQITTTGLIVHLFGSMNPRTGQIARDSSDPICWT
ncbi:hypothetical protein ACIGCM_03595 [Pseudomonas sp. NPDC078700]|uniref:hypothetical protein n=1 Tax=Pseudomonas sp. NPDC078700 TaxID=3364424 RepID=UPI0037C68CA6